MHFCCAAAEHFMALYVFVIYLEETDFLFNRLLSNYELDFHGSFYIGTISFVCSLVAALVVYTDSSISKVPKSVPAPYAFDNYCFTGDDGVYEFVDEHRDYLLYQHNYENLDEWYVSDNSDTFDGSYDESTMYSDCSSNDIPWQPDAARDL